MSLINIKNAFNMWFIDDVIWGYKDVLAYFVH